MVQFNFKLSDQDAENLFDIIQSEYCRMLENSIHEQDVPKAVWYRKHARYIQELKAKLKNRRVK